MKELAPYIALLEKEITTYSFPKDPKNLYEPLSYFLSLGGKRIRPALTLMGAELFGKGVQEAIPAALAVEYFHNFTLIHDDIMDAAPLRRNKETVHTKWNSNIAILSGDVLFVHAYSLLAKQDPSVLPQLMQIFNTTAIEVCEGQQFDMDFEERMDVTVEEYIEMIRLKTSVLLGCALKMGAIIAGANEQDQEKIYAFGQHLGIAFQIQDDILDLYADPEKFGKQVGGDVIANKKTLLNLLAIDLANEQQKDHLKLIAASTNPHQKVEDTRRIYDTIGVKEICEEKMQEYFILALENIHSIAVDESLKQPLIKLAKFLMSRES